MGSNATFRFRAQGLVVAGVLAIYWKLIFTNQYSFLEFSDANQVLPWLQVQVFALRHWSLLLWDPYEWAGQSLVGQLQPSVFSPFTWLLALAPLDRYGHVQIQNVNLWFALLHVVAALFAYALFRDLALRKPAAVVGALFYGTGGFLGNTPWPQMLESALWAPLVFLFLLRSFRGLAPIRSAAIAGAALGLSWCGGHQGPSLTLSLAVCATCIWALCINRSHGRQAALLRTATMLLICGLVSAVQTLPSLEYGQRSVRWTDTGVKQWDDPIPYTEHESSSLSPVDLLHIVVPGGNEKMGDPFTGIVALSLAALAVVTGFRRREIRIFFALAVGALLYSIAGTDFLYGLLYALFPFVAKLREPMLATSVFHFAMAALVAFGADRFQDQPDQPALRIITRGLVWFAGIAFGLFWLVSFLRPPVTRTIANLDPRITMIAFIALLFAAALQSSIRNVARPMTVVGIMGFLLLLEQGNETGTRWPNKSDTSAVYLAPFTETQDLADFLHKQPQPYRIDVDREHLAMNFGDWNNIDTVVQYTPTAPADTYRLNWWQDRLVALYGMDYSISKAPTRPGQQDLFTSTTGYKIFRNPQAFPRAWAVHQIVNAKSEDAGALLVREGNIDLKTTVVMSGETPALQPCSAPDTVDAAVEQPSKVSVDVYMACTGMLAVSDNWYPGWVATVDGKPTRIWKIDTAFRGVVVPAGQHKVVMQYRPRSVYFGIPLALSGLMIVMILQLRREVDGVDLLA